MESRHHFLRRQINQASLELLKKFVWNCSFLNLFANKMRVVTEGHERFKTFPYLCKNVASCVRRGSSGVQAPPLPTELSGLDPAA